jgi:hypothetical protein
MPSLDRKTLTTLVNTYLLLVLLLGLLRFPPDWLSSNGPRFPERPIAFNIEWWIGVGEAQSSHGVFHTWTPYPPLFPLLFRGMNKLSGGDPVLLVYLWWLVNALSLAILASVILRLRGFSAGLGTVLVFSISTSFVGIGIQADQFDLLPCALLGLGILGLSKNRPLEAGIAAGVGAATKVFPGLLAFVALGLLPRRDGFLFILGLGLSLVISLLPFYLADSDTFMSTWRWSLAREGWESIYTYPDLKLPPMPAAETLTRPVTSPLPSTESNWSPPLWMLILAQGTLVFWLRKRSDRSCLDFSRGALASVLLLLLLSRGCSSYYSAWVMGLLFLVYSCRPAMLLAGALLLLANLEWIAWSPAGSSDLPFYWVSIFGRHILFAILLVDVLRRIGSPAPIPPAQPSPVR